MSISALEESPRPAAVMLAHGPACPCGGCQSIFAGGGTAIAGGTSFAYTGPDRIDVGAPAPKNLTAYADTLGLTHADQAALHADMLIAYPGAGDAVYAATLASLGAKPPGERRQSIAMLHRRLAQ